jgi:hypothetical protein
MGNSFLFKKICQLLRVKAEGGPFHIHKKQVERRSGQWRWPGEKRGDGGHSISPLARTFLIAVITGCYVVIPAIGRTSPPGILRGRRVSLLSANSQPDRYVYPTSGEEIPAPASIIPYPGF